MVLVFFTELDGLQTALQVVCVGSYLFNELKSLTKHQFVAFVPDAEI
jgi:hypothetical protein